MGNTQTNNNSHNKKSILISHPEFENAKIIKNTQSKQMVEIGTSMKSEKDFLLYQKNYKRIPKIQSLLYPQDIKFENKGCCGSTGVVYIQYQRFPYVLSQQINLRRNKSRGHFNESQLWLLMYNLLSCAQIFHVRKLKVGDIRPQNVFMNQQGSIKIASQFSFPYGSTNYQKTLMNRQIVTYLAPQQVKNLQLGKMKDTNDPSTVQAFSIGLTLLDTALLSVSQKYYEPNGIFSNVKLNQSLKLLNTLDYSSQLIQIIIKLCEINPLHRTKIIQILQYLKPFENQIMAKKPFNIKSLPYSQQNPQNGFNDISRISMNKSTNNIVKQNDFKYINGVVFDHLQNSMQFSSLHQSKELVLKTKMPNTYEVKQVSKITQLTSPVRTTIHQPPIVISLPQPIQYNVGPNGNSF